MLRTSSVCRFLLFGFLVSSLGGCVHVKPWERGKLAHPTMSAGSMSGPGEEHMYGVHEGAVGGADGAESGCGCN